jgi:hypothetical protein
VRRTCLLLTQSGHGLLRCKGLLIQINANPATWAEILYLLRWQPTRRVLKLDPVSEIF